MTASGGGRCAAGARNRVEVGDPAFDFDDRAGRVVAHAAAQPEGGRGGVDERPEAHALDDSVHSDTQAAAPGHGGASASRPAAHQLQALQGGLGTGAVGFLDDETHVNDHPVAGSERLVRQHADVDLAVFARDVDERELVAVALQHPDDLSRDSQAHDSALRVTGVDSWATAASTAATRVGNGCGDSLGQPDALGDVVDFTTDHDRVRGQCRRARSDSRTPRPGPWRVRPDRGLADRLFVIGLEHVQRAGPLSRRAPRRPSTSASQPSRRS